MAKKGKNAEVAESGGEGIRLSAHRAPGATSPCPGLGGLIAFAVVLKLARGAGLPWPDAIERGVLGGIVGYLAAWMDRADDLAPHRARRARGAASAPDRQSREPGRCP